MKLKCFFVVLAILLLLGAVSAASNDIDYFAKNTTVTVHGMDFMIPAGYGPYEDVNLNETEDGVTQECQFFINEDDEIIMVGLVYGNDINQNLDNYKSTINNPEKVTINGQEGYQGEKNGYQFFVYLKDNNVVILEAHSDNYFEDMIC